MRVDNVQEGGVWENLKRGRDATAEEMNAVTLLGLVESGDLILTEDEIHVLQMRLQREHEDFGRAHSLRRWLID